jgi:trimeric autotransporter adhesin
MTKKQMLILAISLTLLAMPKTSFSQTLNLGILSSFEAYTGAGGITNGTGAIPSQAMLVQT